MATIYKRQRGDTVLYYVIFSHHGRQVWRAAGKRWRNAQRLKIQIEHEIEQGIYSQLPELTMDEFADEFLAAHKARVRPKTLAGYESHLRVHIRPFFGDKKLRSLRPPDIEAFLASLSDGDMSPATQAKYLRTLKTMLKKATQLGYLAKSPAEHIAMPRVPKKEMNVLAPAEIRRLLEATPDEHRCLLTVAAYTGMRKGEILGLQWGDVDAAGKRILVRRTLQQGCFYEPKTKTSRRSVSVPPRVIEALETHRLEQAVWLETNDRDLVFTNTLGRAMDPHNVTGRVFEPALRLAGLPRVRFHDLRHSYAAALISAGENIKWIQRQLGHSSIMVTMDTYGHLLPDLEREASERLERVLDPGDVKENVKAVTLEHA